MDAHAPPPARICTRCGYPMLIQDDDRCPKCNGRGRVVKEQNWIWRRVKWERQHPEDRPPRR